MSQPAVISQIDQQLASAALQKSRRGEVPTQQEQRALRRVQKADEERRRWEYYATVPKGHYLQLCGRPAKVVNEQADRYGFPLRGNTVDLSLVLSAFHRFLAENKHKLAAVGEDPMSGESSPMLEKWRGEKYLLARLERQEREGSLLPIDQVQEIFTTVGRHWRRATDRLVKRFGPEVRPLIEHAMEQARDEIARALADPDDTKNRQD